jgi:2-polyprenyl-6-hydroxyphenyl methylase/3-demethylubiquinone-9 3-methyltransferase
MDAAALGFRDSLFDAVICIQNGISAFRVDPLQLVREALRVTRSGGRVLLSSYAEDFWESRLEWFEVQAAHGLIGKIDPHATGKGVIVCEDGFRATTFGPDDFRGLAAAVDLRPSITEVAGASLFCTLAAP